MKFVLLQELIETGLLRLTIAKKERENKCEKNWKRIKTIKRTLAFQKRQKRLRSNFLLIFKKAGQLVFHEVKQKGSILCFSGVKKENFKVCEQSVIAAAYCCSKVQPLKNLFKIFQN